MSISTVMSTSTVMSVYIPHVFSNINEDRIIRVFESLSLGKVKHIDFVEKMSTHGATYNAAYIHFDYWYDTVVSASFQERVRNPEKEARLVYDEPWYWIVLENRGSKGARKLRINLTDMTPVKKQKQIQPPAAPIKNKYYNNTSPPNLRSVKRKLVGDFILENDEHEQILDKIEEMLDEEDRHTISIDGRYVQSMEHHLEDLLNTNRKWYGEALQYFQQSGLSENKIRIMQDEIDSLRAQVAVLEDREFGSMV
jgi:hypothetical protein